MRVLFWGTSDFALPTLRALHRDHEVAAVVTQPDRPAGRGRSVRRTAVKRLADELGLETLQPEEPRGEAFLARLSEREPEIAVVAAYGEILTEAVLELPPRGSINVHASLLPALRGAAPINWAIIRGHDRTGVTIMRMVRELDAGPILDREAVPIGPRTTAGDLFERLSSLGAERLLETLDRLGRGEVEEREQDHDAATYAPKLDRETARLDWSESAEALDRWIRGCDPWPAAWTRLGEGEEALRVQLFVPRPRPAVDAGDVVPGTVLRADPKDGLRVATGGGVLDVGEVKPAGSRRMEAAEWVRGRGVEAGQRFT